MFPTVSALQGSGAGRRVGIGVGVACVVVGGASVVVGVVLAEVDGTRVGIGVVCVVVGVV